jgi:DNA-directed RNA polymerase specialized sigma24 family protein
VPIEESHDWRDPRGDEVSSSDVKYDCLETCLASLGREDRSIIDEYYRHRKGAKIDNRKEIAANLGVGMNALRIRAFRIRRRLQECVLECVKKRSNEEMELSIPHIEVRRSLL